MFPPTDARRHVAKLQTAAILTGNVVYDRHVHFDGTIAVYICSRIPRSLAGLLRPKTLGNRGPSKLKLRTPRLGFGEPPASFAEFVNLFLVLWASLARG